MKNMNLIASIVLLSSLTYPAISAAAKKETASKAGASSSQGTRESMSPESLAWVSELATTCKTKDAAGFNAALDKLRKPLAEELNSLQPKAYTALSIKDDPRVVFFKMTWPRDMSYANDRFSNDKSRLYCARLHLAARNSLTTAAKSRSEALKAVKDFEECATMEFVGNSTRPLPAPLGELVTCYREKAEKK